MGRIDRPNHAVETAAMVPSPEATAPVLIAESQGEVARLTLNRPDRRNALSGELLRELDGALARIADDPRVRAVVIAARGPVFCSGHDLGEMLGRSAEDYRGLFSLCSRPALSKYAENLAPIEVPDSGSSVGSGLSAGGLANTTCTPKRVVKTKGVKRALIRLQ
jgi:enoyl-CoA hydratase/isomerase-like protein